MSEEYTAFGQEGVFERIVHKDWSTMIASQSGGQGRTTLAQVPKLALGFAADQEKASRATLISVDAGGGANGTTESRLHRIEKGTIDVRFGADLDEQLRDADAAAAVFDPLFKGILGHENVVIDLGANTVDAVFDWVRFRRLGGYLGDRKLTLLVATTSEVKAMRDAVLVLEMAENDGLPIGKKVLAFVESAGEYEETANVERRQLDDYCATHKIPKVIVPKVNLAFSTQWGMPFGDFWRYSIIEYQKAIVERHGPRPPFLPMSTMMDKFGTWMEQVSAQLVKCEVLPEFDFKEKDLCKPGETFPDQ